MQNPVCGTDPGMPDRRASHHLIEAKDEIAYIHDLLRLMHMASTLIPEVERRAFQAGLSMLGTRLDCVLESIRWAEEGRA